MNVVPTFDLNQEHKQRTLRVKALAVEISRLEKLLYDKKSLHASAMQNLCKVNIYKELAKYDNNNQYFEWLLTQGLRYENNNKQYNNSFWEFKTPTLVLKIRLKLRDDLKVWKYELHVSGTKVHFDSYEYKAMYERTLKNSWNHSYTNFLSENYSVDVLNQKFKTEEEAMERVEEWKQELEAFLSFEIHNDKNLYDQAVQKYKECVFVQINHECSKTFYEKLEEYNLPYEKEDYYNVEVKGQRAKELIQELKNEMNFTILAG